MSVPRIRTDAELDARVKLLNVDQERFYLENPNDKKGRNYLSVNDLVTEML